MCSLPHLTVEARRSGQAYNRPPPHPLDHCSSLWHTPCCGRRTATCRHEWRLLLWQEASSVYPCAFRCEEGDRFRSKPRKGSVHVFTFLLPPLNLPITAPTFKLIGNSMILGVIEALSESFTLANKVGIGMIVLGVLCQCLTSNLNML